MLLVHRWACLVFVNSGVSDGGVVKYGMDGVCVQSVSSVIHWMMRLAMNDSFRKVKTEVDAVLVLYGPNSRCVVVMIWSLNLCEGRWQWLSRSL